MGYTALARMLWKPALGLGVVALIWWQLYAFGERREAAGKAQVQAEWDAADLLAKQVADKATHARELADAADAARNLEIENAHAKELAAATADTARLSRLLHAARSASSGHPATQVAGESGTPAPSPQGGSGEADALDRAIADVIAESRSNASQLDSLIAELKPQM